MPTYDDSLSLATTLNMSRVGNREHTFSVSNTFVHDDGLKSVLPNVTLTLSPEQTIKGVLPNITTLIEHTQEIRKSISSKDIETNLTFTQEVRSSFRQQDIEHTLVFSQTIDTSESIIAETEKITYSSEFGFSLLLNANQLKTVTTAFVHTQGITAYVLPFITINGQKYAFDHIKLGGRLV